MISLQELWLVPLPEAAAEECFLGYERVETSRPPTPFPSHKGDNTRELMVSEPLQVTGFSPTIPYEGV